MKRVGPVLLLGLVLGFTYLLANTGYLSLVNSPDLSKESFTVKYTTFYSGCHHDEVAEESHPKQKWAELLESLSSKGWIITNFTAEQVELEKEVAKLCFQCQDKEFVGIYGNEIGVYAGIPEKPGPLKQVIPVNIGQLPQAEIDDLKAGIVCNEVQDKWRILEGYQN